MDKHNFSGELKDDLLMLKVSQAYTGLSSIKRDKIRYFLQYIIFTFYYKCVIPTWLESLSYRILKSFKQSRDRILSLDWGGLSLKRVIFIFLDDQA